MRQVVSIGLFSLLLCHTLAYMLVFLGINWQEERDLSNRLAVYRTVDSIVEFYVPLHEKTSEEFILPQQKTEGFVYKGSFYDIVRVDVQHDTLLILGFVNKTHSLWSQDLLSFIHHQVSGESGKSQQKAGHFLQILLKEYCPFSKSVLPDLLVQWRTAEPLFPFLAALTDRVPPVHSPPPRA